MRQNDYQFIRDIVYQHSRINLGADKHELVSARLGKRLRATGKATISDYCELLRTPAGAEELGNLIDVISTNHTYFFERKATSRRFGKLFYQILFVAKTPSPGDASGVERGVVKRGRALLYSHCLGGIF